MAKQDAMRKLGRGSASSSLFRLSKSGDADALPRPKPGTLPAWWGKSARPPGKAQDEAGRSRAWLTRARPRLPALLGLVRLPQLVMASRLPKSPQSHPRRPLGAGKRTAAHASEAPATSHNSQHIKHPASAAIKAWDSSLASWGHGQ